MTTHIPVADGGLWLEYERGHGALLDSWLPRPHPDPSAPLTTITLRPLPELGRSLLATARDGKPTLTIGTVGGWLDATTRRVVLAGREGAAILDLRAGTGTLDQGKSTDEGYTMLTLAAGLLLAAAGRVLLHAGAVQRPDGGVLLVAGDTHSGKSTTTLTLARSPGWAWLSDDQVVLVAHPDDGIEVLGWARRPHLDAGYALGESTGERQDADAALVGALPWVPRGRLAGSLLPRVEPGQTSLSRPASAGVALEVLVRQGAWIMAEAQAARAALAVLKAAVEHPALHLELGLDSYGRPERLMELLPEAGR